MSTKVGRKQPITTGSQGFAHALHHRLGQSSELGMVAMQCDMRCVCRDCPRLMDGGGSRAANEATCVECRATVIWNIWTLGQAAATEAESIYN